MKNMVEQFVNGNGLVLGVKCAGCKRMEYATPEETKSIFISSLKIAGWKWKQIGQSWFCDKCVEKGL